MFCCDPIRSVSPFLSLASAASKTLSNHSDSNSYSYRAQFPYQVDKKNYQWSIEFKMVYKMNSLGVTYNSIIISFHNFFIYFHIWNYEKIMGFLSSTYRT